MSQTCHVGLSGQLESVKSFNYENKKINIKLNIIDHVFSALS